MEQMSESSKARWKKDIERSRSMSVSEKFLAGAILFEEACEATRREIRSMNPGWTDDQVEAGLEKHLDLDRRDKESALILCSVPPFRSR